MSGINRGTSVLTSLVLMVGTLVGLTNSSASANTGPLSVSLVSPAPGTVINPDLPFVISLAITGGSAATAKKCFDWDNRDLFGDLSFGAQIIDVNNYGKTLSWGGNGTIFKTDGELYDWSPKIIPNGIQCSIGVIETTGSSYWPAAFEFFRDTLSEPTDSTNQKWFGTKSSNDIDYDVGLSKYEFFDIAWKLNGKVTKVRFQATNLGSSEVTLTGLQRGQTIDYEAKFQVTGTVSKQYENNSLYIGFSDGQEASRCEPLDQGVRIDNGDGTVTYILDCVTSLVESEMRDETYEIIPVVATSLESYANDQGAVIVNVGRQGTPPCVGALDGQTQEFGKIQQGLKKAGRQFKTVVTAAAARAIQADLQDLIEMSRRLASESNATKAEIELCGQRKTTLAENLVSLSTEIRRFVTTIQNFIDDPAAQARAKARAEAARKKAVAQQRAAEREMYNYGVRFVGSLTTSDLNQLYLWRFVSPGKSTLTRPLAQDWCRQLPTIVIGLPNRVGYPAHPNFVKGCTEAAMKIKF